MIPKDYKQAINETRNEVSFLVNCSLLSGAFFLICGVVLLYKLFFGNIDFANINYLVIDAVISLVLAWFFYRASLISVGGFGYMIRSAYDLFRFDLLKQLRLDMPDNYEEEFYAWKNIGGFIVMGQHFLDFEGLEYHHQKDN